MSTTMLDSLTPDTRERAVALLKLAKDNGLDVRVVSGRRTCEQQDSMNKAGNTPVRGCRSWHVWGRAVDIAIRDGGKFVSWKDPRYHLLGKLGKEIGFRWGGDFNWWDPVHFEWHPGTSMSKACPNPDDCKNRIASFEVPPGPPLDPSNVQPQPPKPTPKPPATSLPTGSGSRTSTFLVVTFLLSAGVLLYTVGKR